MASFFYPWECQYKDFWSVPGATFDERSKTYVACEGNKARVGAIIGAIVVILIIVVMLFLPVDKPYYKIGVIGVGALLLIGIAINGFFAEHFARVYVMQVQGEYDTWKQSQPLDKQKLGAYSLFRAPLDTQLEAARIMAPRQQASTTQTSAAAGVGSFLGTLAADYMKQNK